LHLYLGSETFYDLPLFRLQKEAISYDENALEDAEEVEVREEEKNREFAVFLEAITAYKAARGNFDVSATILLLCVPFQLNLFMI
jgi:hypothetical protein